MRNARRQDDHGDEVLDSVPVEQPVVTVDEQWADVSEAMLFEMFPDDVEDVEDALLRFAGLPHAAARALEALLARPSQSASKTILAAEDALDYDCVDANEDGFSDLSDELCNADDLHDGFWLEVGAPPCVVCAESAAELGDDGLPYCQFCWDEWTESEIKGNPIRDNAVDEEPHHPTSEVPPRLEATSTVATRRWGARRSVHEEPLPPPGPLVIAAEPCAPKLEERDAMVASAGGALQSSLSGERHLSGDAGPRECARFTQKHQKSTFFESLDGAVKWEKAPARPEAGGKELVVLQAKEERDLMDPIARGSRKNANFQVQMSVAAVRSASVSDTPPLPVRCRELLEAIRPQIENSVVEYLVDLVTEDVSEDTREAAIEILTGHGVMEAGAETFWETLTAR